MDVMNWALYGTEEKTGKLECIAVETPKLNAKL